MGQGRPTNGEGLLSIDDHPEIRRVFAGFDLVPLQIRYTVARDAGGRDDTPSGELFIKNRDNSRAQLR